MIKELSLLSIWLESAFRLNTSAIDELLPLLSPLSILIKGVKFGVLTVQRLHSFLLHHYLLRNFGNLRFE